MPNSTTNSKEEKNYAISFYSHILLKTPNANQVILILVSRQRMLSYFKRNVKIRKIICGQPGKKKYIGTLKPFYNEGRKLYRLSCDNNKSKILMWQEQGKTQQQNSFKYGSNKNVRNKTSLYTNCVVEHKLTHHQLIKAKTIFVLNK